MEQLNETKSIQERINSVIQNKDKQVNVPDLEKFNQIVDNPLTPKEYDILTDVIKRKTNLQIAQDQQISLNTVKYHLKNIYSKLDIPNKKEVQKLVLEMKSGS